MASSFLSSILANTRQVLGSVRRWAVSPSSSSDPRSSVLEDLKKLEGTLKRIQAVLHDAEEREIRDEAVKLWLEELKEVAYDAEDVLDEYDYEELRAQAEGRASRKRKRVEGDDEEEVSGSLSTIVVSIPDGMGDRIREIREWFDRISEDRERLRLREEDGERRVLEAPNPAPSSHMVDESSIYGRVDDKKKVTDLLLSEGMGKGFSVIPIVGKGGLGKTTIAQLVYNDSKVKEYFDLTGWVCVSDDFDVTRLTKAIIESITEESCNLTELSSLQNTLEEKVKGKRVLLVLDDVWNEQQSRWESLRIPFVGAESTVRIIMTCRNDSVAKIMQTDVSPYHPSCLSPEQSWSLFRHYAFGGGDGEEQPSLADIGKQIVEKCSGLPLAVKTIGSLLRHEIDEDGWMEVLQSDLWELDRNNEILGSLRLSYGRMPAHLKPCFVYCSMFPKDHEFDEDELVRLWMAQGYIPSGGRRRMEDAGHEYFNDLLRRSFFDSFYGYFKMHDMIHDLAKFIGGNECYAIVDKKLPDFPEKVRHLYVKDADELVKSLSSCNLRDLRTLLPWDQHREPMVIREMTKFLPLLRCLRVLEFSWQKHVEIPDLLGNLKHLRYLHIYFMRYYDQKLPESVCDLYHLQTLIVESRGIVELPNGIGSLTNLRYLNIPSTSPVGIIRKLTNLQTLRARCTVHDSIGALKPLVDLPALCITGLRNVVNIEDAKDAGLKHKHQLQWLSLCWNASGYEGLRAHLPDHLCVLRLNAFREESKDVPTDEKREEAMLEYLQPHANLKLLVIHGYGGSKFPKWVGNLRSLEDLHIYKCPQLRLLSAEGLLSKLQILHVEECQQLTSLPGLQNLTSLQTLTIDNCPQLQLLSEEGLPSKLQNLYIGECQQLTSLPGMQNLTSLEVLTIKNCSQLQLLSEEGVPSKLLILHTEECQQLTSLPGMQNLNSLRELTIKNCPQLQLLSEEGLPSSLFRLHIEDCQQLTSLPGMQNLTYLTELSIKNCSQLQLLSEKGLPSKLQKLCIEDCQQLTSLPGMQNQPSLEALTINNCSQLQLSSEEGLPFKLRFLYIKECERLTSLPGMQNLTSLKQLIIKNCPELRLLSEEGLPSNLQKLDIENCQQLTSLQGMQNLTFLEAFTIKNCPKLQIMAEDQLSSVPCHVKIIDCPGLSNWCQIQKINCFQVASGKKLTMSNTWENIKQGFNDMTSTEHGFDKSSTSTVEFLQPRSHLFIHNNWNTFYCPKTPVSVYEELTILSCTRIPNPWWLSVIGTCLHRLVIKDCPGVELLPDELLPSTLKSLVVDSCENLRSLRLAQTNRDALEELQIVNCPMLAMVEGLKRLFFPKFLRIKGCPQLPFSQEG